MSETPEATDTPESEASQETNPAKAAEKKRRFPWVLAVFTVAVFVTIFILRLIGPNWDVAIVVLISNALLFVLAITLLVWFAFRSPYSAKVRKTGIIGIVSLGLMFVSAYKVKGVDGSMNFEFEPRAWVLNLFGWNVNRDLSVAEKIDIDLTTTTPKDFPSFLGQGGLGMVNNVSLATDWEASPPEELWRTNIGDAWSGFAVVNGYAVTLEQVENEEVVSCFEVKTGKLIWAVRVAGRHDSLMGGLGPRSTPTIVDGMVYAFTATGQLICIDGNHGTVTWKKDVLADFGIERDNDINAIFWGRSASPLVVDDLVIVPPGGPKGGTFVSLVAYDRLTGDKVWEGGDQQASYASPIFGTLAGTPQIISVNESTVTGHDPTNGKQLWTFDWPGSSGGAANTSQPVIVGDNQLLVSKGYAQGSKLMEFENKEGEITPEIVWEERNLLKTKLTSPFVKDGFAYALSDTILECVDLEAGKRLWKKGRYGHGQMLIVGEHLLILSEEGELVLAKADPDDPEVLATHSVLSDKTWNTFALYGDLALVRNGEEAACFRLPTK